MVSGGKRFELFEEWEMNYFVFCNLLDYFTDNTYLYSKMKLHK